MSGVKSKIPKSTVWIVYKTTNLVTGKIYIGVHNSNEEDGYFGSGNLIGQAYKKYGKEKFYRETLFIFDNETAAYDKEAEIVTEEFIKESTNYNLTPGGKIPPSEHRNTSGWKHSEKGLANIKAGAQKASLEGKRIGENHWTKTHPIEEVKEKFKKIALINERMKDKPHPTYVRSEQLRENSSLRVSKYKLWTNGISDSFNVACPDGWRPGRSNYNSKNKVEVK